MFARRTPSRFTAWLVALAVLWGAWLPVVSHAVAAHQSKGTGWVEVCTATGMAWVASAEEGAASQSDNSTPGMNMAGCDWCATHTPLLGVPKAAQPSVAPTAFGVEVPAACLQSPRPLFVWAAAQSRAPPVSA
ncbi:MAG: DUF2946 domain-containing protein [Burkholderiaceae bacterium]